ncbi:GNAT family N-acetyltransferase [Paenibacillus hodogayensis]|uniref:GNAT family N-acetyltransferase n=1 Tax=Paenibacillus hodogayensis TaxID=279208 RepID=A0ABV5W1Z9_9BACL
MKSILRAYKHAPEAHLSSYCIPIFVDGKSCGRLRPLTIDSLHREEEMRLLTEWRGASAEWFTSQFPVTVEGTRQWVDEQILQADDRILFLVEDEDMTPIGQVGLLHYDEDKKECEFDNLLRGRKGRFGNIILYALLALGEWGIRQLGLQTGYLNVLGDNHRAMHIYRKLGFREVRRVPLRKVTEGDVTRWVTAPELSGGEAERELVTMSVATDAYYEIIKQFQ